MGGDIGSPTAGAMVGFGGTADDDRQLGADVVAHARKCGEVTHAGHDSAFSHVREPAPGSNDRAIPRHLAPHILAGLAGRRGDSVRDVWQDGRVFL